MAHGAVSCLKLTIERLKNSSYIVIVQNSSPQIIELLYEEVCSFQNALEEFDKRRSTINMKMVKTLEANIMDVVYKFEDVIESYVLDRIQSQSEESHHGDQIHPPLMLFSVDLQELKQDVDSFIKTVKEMKRAYIHELHNPSPEEKDEEGDVVPSGIEFGGNHESMIGFSKYFIDLRSLCTTIFRDPIVSIKGMAGIGKTTLANKLFQDPSIVRFFKIRAFVTIGPKYLLKKVLLDILIQVNPDIEITNIDGEILAELERMVRESLKDQPYLIVLDDIWDKELCSHLTGLFPDDDSRSLVLLTSRLDEVLDGKDKCQCVLPLLDKKESWDLLRQKVFGQETCSYELAKAGKKIAENCEGLPLTIVTVANILSKVDKSPEYWNMVASDKQNSVYKDAYDQMLKVLYPSYDYLEQRFKACFLYMGAYPQGHKMCSTDMFMLYSLWNAEGIIFSAEQFRERIPHSELVEILAEDIFSYYVFKLFLKSVILVDYETSDYFLHSSFWYLCNKEAAKNKFFYTINCPADALTEEDLNHQRRLSIRNNVLLAIENVHNSISYASTVRSLLCLGPYHHYPIPLCLEQVRLLRVLHAVTIRFYEFPIELLKLVPLRYLCLTYNGNIPSSISKLWNLQWLIISRELVVENYLSCIPMEIWDMKELMKLNVGGRNLSVPREGSLLPNLLGLYGLHHQSCTKDVFEGIPNLTELTIVIRLSHDNIDKPSSCFNHISHLHKLTSLTCAVTNPTFEVEVVAPRAPLSDLPLTLTKLFLSGLGYPWKEMSKISSSLPNLRHLTLQCYAFRGPKWEVHDKEFQRLSYITIEDSELEEWTFQNDHECMPAINSLSIKHCYKLKEIPLRFGTSLRHVNVIDCNPIVVNFANKLKEEWDDKYAGEIYPLTLNVHSSWNDENILL